MTEPTAPEPTEADVARREPADACAAAPSLPPPTRRPREPVEQTPPEPVETQPEPPR